jgi:hypothetical protein
MTRTLKERDMSNDKQEPSILLSPHGAISAEDKGALREVGVIVVEVEDPSQIKFIRPHGDVDASLLLESAVSAIVSHSSNGPREHFGAFIARRLHQQFVRERNQALPDSGYEE